MDVDCTSSCVENFRNYSTNGDIDLPTVLTEFAEYAQKFNYNECTQDVVTDYIQQSSDCQELLSLIKIIPEALPKNAGIYMTAVTAILTRFAADLKEHSKVGCLITADILHYNISVLKQFVKNKSKKNLCIALNLIASMISQGPDQARNVFTMLNMSGPIFCELFDKPDPEDAASPRALFLNVIILLLSFGDNNLIRQIIGIKGFLNGVFPLIKHDRAEEIVHLLQTFTSKILENPSISKTSKIRLFNDYTLSYMMPLFSWNGPTYFQKAVKRKLGQSEILNTIETDVEDRSAVRNAVYSFMVNLCCSHKTGIVFRDSSFVATKNNNHVITNILKKCLKPYSNILLGQFIGAVLKACPEQFRFYLPELKQCLALRLTLSWFQAMELVKNILEDCDSISLICKSSQMSISALFSVSKFICVPNLFTADELLTSLKTSHPFVCYYLMEYLNCVLKRLKFMYDYYLKNKTINTKIEDFKQQFISFFSGSLPDVKTVENYWMQVSCTKIPELNEETVETLQGVTFPSLSQLLSLILNVLTLYRDLGLKPLHEVNATFSCLMDSLKNCLPNMTESEAQSLKLQLIDFSCCESNGNVVTNVNENSSQLLLLLQTFATASSHSHCMKIRRLLCNLFLSSSFYQGSQWEISIWLDVFDQHNTEEKEELCLFLNAAFKLLEINYVKVADTAIKKEEQVEVTEMKSYSNLVTASMQQLKESPRNEICQRYVQNVLNDIIHRELSPTTLLAEIKKHQCIFDEEKINYWEFLSHFDLTKEYAHVKPSKKDCLNRLLQDSFMSFHLSYKKSKCEDKNHFENVIEKLSTSVELSTQSYKVSQLFWQLLKYIDLESCSISKNGPHKSSLSSYIQMLQLLLMNNVAEDDTMKKVLKEIHVQQLEQLVLDLMQHPVVKKCFLHVPTEKNTKLIIQEISKFVFSVLEFYKSTIPTECNKSILLPLKDTAVSYCNSIITSDSIEDDTMFFKFDMIKETVTSFATILSFEDNVSLLRRLLALDDKLLMELDPDCSVMLNLVQNLEFHKDSCHLLPTDVFKRLILKCFQKNKKLKHVSRSVLVKWLRLHPPYALFLTDMSDDVVSLLLTHQNDSSREILQLLIANNTTIALVAENEALNALGSAVPESKQDFWVSIIIECLKANQNALFMQNVCGFLCEYTVGEFITNTGRDLSHSSNVPQGIKILIQQDVIDGRKIKEMMNILKESAEHQLLNSKCILLFVELYSILHSQVNETFSPSSQLLFIMFTWLKHGLKSKNEDTLEHFDVILDFLRKCLQFCKSSKLQKTFWNNFKDLKFVFRAVKLSLRDFSTGIKLFKVLNILLPEVINPQLCDMEKISSIVTDFSTIHTEIISVLENSEDHCKEIKGLLLQWLSIMLDLNLKIVSSDWTPNLLKGYCATLSFSDQHTLCLLKRFDEEGADVNPCSTLWGRRMNLTQQGTQDTKYAVPDRLKIQEIFRMFDSRLLLLTATNFPLHLPYEIQIIDESVLNRESASGVKWDEIYDPRFLFNILSSLLSPGSYVNHRDFVASGVLEVLFASLSSYDQNIRAVGYYCISQFYTHLEGSMWGQRFVWLSFLDYLKHSINTANQRLPVIITLFMIKSANILKNPYDKMYLPITEFLTVKPILDVGQVPEFYKLFNSNDVDYRLHRNFMLSLVSESLRTSLDYHVCQKRYIFSILLPYFTSCISTPQEKVKILKMIHLAVSVFSNARTLCREGLLGWINSIIKSSLINCEIAESLVEVMDALKRTYIDTESSTKNEGAEFELVHLNLTNYINLNSLAS